MKKYSAIYFDLDDTLVRDNPVTGRSELMESGLEKYKELKEKYPKLPFRLLTQRLNSEIKYPEVYVFDEIIGKDNMKEFVNSIEVNIPFRIWIKPINWYRILRGKKYFNGGSTHKVWYLFVKHILKGEEVLMIDDDRRVSRFYR